MRKGRGTKAWYTAGIEKSDKWWVGWIEEVPGANCQQATRADLLESLRVTLREALEFNRRDAIKVAERASTKNRSSYEAWRSFSPSVSPWLHLAVRTATPLVVREFCARRALRCYAP